MMQRVQFDLGKPDLDKLLSVADGDLLYRGVKRRENDKTSTTIMHGRVPYITYNIFAPYADEMIHGFSTRLGGVSREHLESLNLSFSRGDDPENVTENFRRFSEAVGFDHTRAVFSDQVHDTALHRVTEEDCGKGIIRESDIRGIDGLMTDVPGIPIMTFFADCVPVFFYDPEHKAIALSHSGWRGTVGDIAGKTIRRMREEFDSAPERIVTAIGPSICMDCYEVSEDVASLFMKKYKDTGDMGTVLMDKGNGKYQLNLHAAVRRNLLAAGVKEEHIAMPDICTCCNPRFLFSHRASKGMRGNLAAVMALK